MSMDQIQIEAEPDPDFDLFWLDRIGAGLGFSAEPDQNRIVMSSMSIKICYVICSNTIQV